ncbi:MAG: GNAT family N-acetyltransferase [Planctomycetota bacterium]
MNFQIRKAVPNDASAIARFQIKMAMETENKRLDEATVLAGVESVLNHASNGFYVVAVQDGQSVGSLMITFEWSDWRNTQIWYIQSVYLEPEARGQGLFSKMFATVKQIAASERVKVIRLYVETENQHAQNVYENLGMKRMPYYMYDINIETENATDDH